VDGQERQIGSSRPKSDFNPSHSNYHRRRSSGPPVTPQRRTMKKYDFTVAPSFEGFSAQVIRRKTSRGVTVEKSQDGFPTKDDAKAWGTQALSDYLAWLQAHKAGQRQNRMRSRARKQMIAQWPRQQTCRSLADCIASGNRAALAEDELRARAERLWREVVFRGLKDGATETRAIAMADEAVGKRWKGRLERARRGKLDILAEGVQALAVANAKRLVNIAGVFQSLCGDKTQD
jgi:hypothetical protein